MRKCRTALNSGLLIASVLVVPSVAWAQDQPAAAPAPAAPAPAAPAEPAPAAPEAGAAAAAPAATPTEPAPAPAPAPAAPADDKYYPSGWMRMDSDYISTLQFWFGATHNIGGSLDIASDIYVNSLQYAEFDIGPQFTVADGKVILIPMVGLGADWGQRKAVSLAAPQFYAYLTFSPIYVEFWHQTFINSVFTEGAGNTIYDRLFAIYNATDYFGIGPEVESTMALNKAAKVPKFDGSGTKSLLSLPVGGTIQLNYGKSNTLLLFLGYETQKEARAPITGADPVTGAITRDEDRGLRGRFTFVKTW